jgi:hypothetical protein
MLFFSPRIARRFYSIYPCQVVVGCYTEKMHNFKKYSILILLTIFSHNVFAVTCVRSGCYNEICSKVGETYFSTWLWKAEYACYDKFGICEVDKCGEFGWRQTDALVECVNIQLKRVQRGDLSSD